MDFQWKTAGFQCKRDANLDKMKGIYWVYSAVTIYYSSKNGKNGIKVIQRSSGLSLNSKEIRSF